MRSGYRFMASMMGAIFMKFGRAPTTFMTFNMRVCLSRERTWPKRPIRPATLRPPPEEHGLDGRKNDEQIERNRHILDVEQVVLELLQRIFDARAVCVAHLRPASEAWPDGMALTVERDQLGQ